MEPRGGAALNPGRLAELLDRHAARPMFFVALLSLIVVAGATHRLTNLLHSPEDGSIGVAVTELEIDAFGWSLVLLWPMFAIEAFLRVSCRPREMSLGAATCRALPIICVPPLRLGSRGYARRDSLWLPGAGWRVVDKRLRRDLERFFGVPMILLAFLTLPLLVVEYAWKEQLRASALLTWLLDVGTSFIWLAFAVELIVMVSVSEKRVRYLARHWVDVVIVLLPLVDVLPALRALRALRLQQLTRIGRAYRLRALVMKLWRAMLVLEVMQRLTGATPEKRLRSLEELARAKQEELDDLRGEIDELRRKAGLNASRTTQG